MNPLTNELIDSILQNNREAKFTIEKEPGKIIFFTEEGLACGEVTYELRQDLFGRTYVVYNYFRYNDKLTQG